MYWPIPCQFPPGRVHKALPPARPARVDSFGRDRSVPGSSPARQGNARQGNALAVEDRRALALHALPAGARAIRPMASGQAAERWLARVHELRAGDGHDGGATAVPAAGAQVP